MIERVDGEGARQGRDAAGWPDAVDGVDQGSVPDCVANANAGEAETLRKRVEDEETVEAVDPWRPPVRGELAVCGVEDNDSCGGVEDAFEFPVRETVSGRVVRHAEPGEGCARVTSGVAVDGVEGGALLFGCDPVSYTHLTLPTIYSV